MRLTAFMFYAHVVVKGVGMSADIGMVGQQFQSCPNRPNCVSSMARPNNKTHYIAPLVYTGTQANAMQDLRSVLFDMSRSKLMKQGSQYLHYEFRSRWLSFVDNVEFYFPEKESIIHMRSASEMGYSDLGVNRQRLEKIRTAFAKTPSTPPVSSGL